MDIFDKEKTVISCFDLTGNMIRPWAEAGYLCYCVDIQHPQGETRQGNIIRVGADMRDWLPPFRPITFAAFFPPCTDVAVSGARWFRDKGLFALFQSIRLFYASIRLAEWTHAPYLIENPVSPPSQPTGANPISPSIPVITRVIQAVKTTCTPRKPASGQGAASSCRHPNDLSRYRAAGCTGFLLHRKE